jgi:hypothetical protein
MGVARKKPVKIEYQRFVLGVTTVKELMDFNPNLNVGVGGLPSDHTLEERDASTDIRWVVVETLEGSMAVSDGDYIIKGVAGEFYPCKPDIFAQTYEIVS